MKYLLIAILLISISCKKEEEKKVESPALVLAPKVSPTIVQFYCGSFARGCEDYSEDSVYISIIDDKTFHLARRYSASENPFSWGFSGDFIRNSKELLLKSDPSFAEAVDKMAAGASSRKGSYSDPIKVNFKCKEGFKNCSVSGHPTEMAGSAFESSMLSFDLKCNQVAIKDESATNCDQ